jgi:4-hydroxy-3-methylbut-2-en-1-yl diphosphate synthase IspG/GcpE
MPTILGRVDRIGIICGNGTIKGVMLGPLLDMGLGDSTRCSSHAPLKIHESSVAFELASA